MGAPGLQRALHPTTFVCVVQQRKARTGRFARLVCEVHHRHAQAVARVTPHRRLHLPLARPGPCVVRQREVLAAHIAGGNHGHQRIHGRTRAGHHHQAAGVLVQPVHDAGTRQQHGLGVPPQQTVQQSAAPVAGCRVHHEARGFVDHQQVFVLKHDVQRHRFRLECLALRRGAQFNAAFVPCAHLRGRLGGHHTIHGDGTRLDQLLQVTAGKLGHTCGQRLVQACAVLGDVHTPVAQFGVLAGVGSFFRAVLHGVMGRQGARYNGFASLQESCL